MISFISALAFMGTVERRACGLPLKLGKRHPESTKRKMRANIGKRNRDEQRSGKKKKNPKQGVISCTYCGEEFGALLYSTHRLLSLDAHSFYVLLTISS